MDRDFLFAIFAVQLGMVRPEVAMAAASGLLSDKSRSLPDRLLDEGAITGDQLKMLRDLTDQAVKTHGGDVKRTVETLGGERAVYASFGGSVVIGEDGRPSLVPQVELEEGEIEDAVSVSQEEPGRYRYRGDSPETSEIGRGGIGRVLIAHDEHIGREIAVKELLADARTGSGSPGESPVSRTAALSARFLREARVTGQLEHPNIMPVYELGKRADGTFYYTMKLVRGRSLADALKEAGNLEQRLKLLPHFVDLCNAVAYAHSRGVMHRDLKPDNVMLGEFGETVVLDWGMAKVRGKEDIRGQELEREVKIIRDAEAGKTVDGAAVGTPAYMSPEQADGALSEIDERSDVWSLGAVLYELLTGRPPFEGMTPFDVIGRVLSDPIAPPRERDAAIPAELEAVALRALTRGKSSRYQKAKQLADEVEAYLTGARVGAYEYSSLELLKRFVKKNRAATALVGLVIVLTIIGGMVLYGAYRQAKAERERAEDSAAVAELQKRQTETKRIESELNLAAALLEKAERLFDDKRFLEARVFAGGSLLHNPVYPHSLNYQQDLEHRHPQGRDLTLSASSMMYQTGEFSRLSSLRWLEVDFATSMVVGSPLTISGSGLVAVLADDDTIRLGDTNGLFTRTLSADEALASIAISSDGMWVCAGTRNGSVLVWNTENDKLYTKLDAGKDSIPVVRFSPDGKRVIAGDRDGAGYTWCTEGWRLVESREWFDEPVSGLAISPDSSLIAATSRYGKLAFFEADTMRLQDRSGSEVGLAHMGTFSPDGTSIVVLGQTGDVKIWNTRKSTIKWEWSMEHEGISAAHSADGSLLLTSEYEGVMRLWETASGTLLDSVQAHKGYFVADFVGDTRDIISVGGDKRVRVWRMSEESNSRTMGCSERMTTALDFNGDGTVLAVAGVGTGGCLWHLPTHTVRARLPDHSPGSWGISFSPDGENIATGGFDGRIVLSDLDSGETRELRMGQPEFYLVYLDDGRTLSFTTRDGDKIHFVDTRNGQVKKTLDGYRTVAVSSDEHWLATSIKSHPTRMLVYDLANGEIAFEREANMDRIWVAEYSPNGRWLATGGLLGSLLLWDTSDYGPPLHLRGHDNFINRMHFSPDSELLATISDDKTARIWSLESGETVLTLRASKEAIVVRFSPDGKQLAMGDGNRVRIYPLDFSLRDADPRQLLADAEQKAGMKLEGFDLVPLNH